MTTYSITDLEKLSGIKAHTLRTWEQRYGIMHPKRTSTNVRYYVDEDLELVLNIAFLNKKGLKISKIAEMSAAEIAKAVSLTSEEAEEYEKVPLDAMTTAMLELNERIFERIVKTNIQKIGFEETMLQLIYPFLEKLSLLWLTGRVKPFHQKFITQLIRQKLMKAINSLPLPLDSNRKKFFLYLPPEEKQDLSLLFVKYVLKKQGFTCIYLGQENTLADLQDAFSIQQPDYIFTIITESFTATSVQNYINLLAEKFPTTEILLTGYQIVAKNIRGHSNVTLLYSLEETLNYLTNLKS